MELSIFYSYYRSTYSLETHYGKSLNSDTAFNLLNFKTQTNQAHNLHAEQVHIY